jgi:hypothetical protein
LHIYFIWKFQFHYSFIIMNPDQSDLKLRLKTLSRDHECAFEPIDAIHSLLTRTQVNAVVCFLEKTCISGRMLVNAFRMYCSREQDFVCNLLSRAMSYSEIKQGLSEHTSVTLWKRQTCGATHRQESPVVVVIIIIINKKKL